jgi:cytochrome c biogenesis protein CcdA/thiol-disulfide isomerase/thioredoxin
MNRKKNKKPEKQPDKGPESTLDTIADTAPGNRQDKKIRTAAILVAVVLLGCAAILGIYLLTMSQPSPAQGTGSHNVTVYYFYGEECPHCHEVKPYIESLRQKYPDVNFRILEIWHDETNNALYTLLNHKLSQEELYVPEVIIGNVSFVGSDEIKAGLETAILEQKGNQTGSSQLGAFPASGISAGPYTNLTATYFYGNGCSHCENVKPLIAHLSAKYPELNLEMLEINNNQTNREKYLAMRLQYGLGTTGSLPTIFIGEDALVGETEVKDQFEEKILAEKQRIASGNLANQTNLTPVGPGSPLVTPALNPFMVVFAALVDSTNPCGLSVLVFLLISMAAAGGRKRILLVGGVYIAAMFLFHLLVGIGLFSAFSLSGLAKPFSIIGGAIALILGIVTLADVLRNKESYLLSIPESGKGLLGTYIRRATLPAAFILGVLAGILGFSCTGGIYISILGLMGRDMTVMAGLPWLILYNLIFILPLVLVTLLVAYGISPERADRWRTEHKHTVRVIIGIILVALGLVILSGWLG